MAKIAYVRLFLIYGCCSSLSSLSVGHKECFSASDLEEEVYMEQPPSFVAQGESSSLVCRLHRSLYSLSLVWEVQHSNSAFLHDS